MKKTGSAFLGLLVAGGLATAQTPRPAAGKADDRAAAYYHYTMGHMYAENAGASAYRADLVAKAIENYRLALKADPDASLVGEELAELYIQSGKLRAGVEEAEEALRQNPEDLTSRRILGRIYTRLIADPQQGRVSEENLKKAIEQFRIIAERRPQEMSNWIMLGRLHKVGQQWTDAEKAYQKALEIQPDNEDALTGLAMVYADLGDNKRATEALQRVAERSPSLRTLMALASSYEQVRDYNRAAETLQRALPFSPDNAELRKALAQNLLMADKLDDARALYEKLAAEEPKEAHYALRLSQVYRQQRDFGKAQEWLDKARAADPEGLEVRYQEVNLLEAQGKTPEAIAVLKGVLDGTAKARYSQAEKANRLIFLERLGLLHRTAEQYEEAAQVFRQMGEVDPDVAARAAAQVADTYRQGRLYAKAEAEAAAAAQRFPDDRMIRTVRATALAEAGKADEAVAELRKLLDGKNDRDVYVSLSQAYEKAKNHAEQAKAIEEIEKLSTTKEEKEQAAFLRAAMFERQKLYDRAEAEFRKVLAVNPENAGALNYLGYMFADRNVRLAEAQELVGKALQLDPDNAAYLDSMGWVLYRQGKLEEAERYLVQAVEKYAKDPTVHDHLGDVYLKRGKLKEAIGEWERSLREYQATSPAERDPVEVAKVQKKLDSARVRLAREASNTGAKQPQ